MQQQDMLFDFQEKLLDWIKQKATTHYNINFPLPEEPIVLIDTEESLFGSVEALQTDKELS